MLIHHSILTMNAFLTYVLYGNKKRRRQFFFQLIGPRKTLVMKKATAYAKSVHVNIRVQHTSTGFVSSYR